MTGCAAGAVECVEDVADAFVRALDAPREGAHVFNLQGETASTGRALLPIAPLRVDALTRP